MAEEQIDELEKKKRELERELREIQGELDHSLEEVRDDVSTKLDPKAMIRKHPLPIVGSAAFLGFLLGHRGPSSRRGSSGGNFKNALFDELKKLATRKAISLATDFVEEILEEKVEEQITSSD